MDLIDNLTRTSPEFATSWSRHEVAPITEGSSEYKHPIVGRMFVDFMTFAVVDRPELRVAVFLPSEKDESSKKMQELVRAFSERCCADSEKSQGCSGSESSRRLTIQSRTKSPGSQLGKR